MNINFKKRKRWVFWDPNNSSESTISYCWPDAGPETGRLPQNKIIANKSIIVSITFYF